jgi:hypothetical protein
MDKKDEDKRIHNMMDLIREEEMKLLAEGVRQRAIEGRAWARVRDLMVRLGVSAPKGKKPTGVE